MGGHRLIAEGPLAAEEVSRRLSAVDVFLGAFNDGVSTRRGSWLAALQHGLACVGTVAYNTDKIFRDAAHDGAIVLIDATDPHGFDKPVVELLSDQDRRNTLANAAAELSAREFAWDRLAAKMLAGLAAAS
jgi:glycosyltransferase involved in cell wall biosynthesis